MTLSCSVVATRLLCGGSLRKLLAGWNQLCRLAERLERSQLEVLDLQHNHLTELPSNLFIKAQRYRYTATPTALIALITPFNSVYFSFLYIYSLRYLNVSANKLECLPASSLSEDSSSSSCLEELYLTNNSLTDKCASQLPGHAQLRVLHLAFNQLQTFTARYCVWGWVGFEGVGGPKHEFDVAFKVKLNLPWRLVSIEVVFLWCQ